VRPCAIFKLAKILRKLLLQSTSGKAQFRGKLPGSREVICRQTALQPELLSGALGALKELAPAQARAMEQHTNAIALPA
jgi:hypothetical protein